MTERRSRERGRGKSYSKRTHTLSEVGRKNRRRRPIVDEEIFRTGEPLESQEGLISHTGESLKANPESTDMEPGKDYPIS